MSMSPRLASAGVVAAVAVGSAAALPTVVSGSNTDRHTSQVPVSSTAWSNAVTRICTGALLFEGRHKMGTMAGAVAVARDIRSSTERRMRRVTRLHAPGPRQDRARRWVALERRLAAAYATSYVRIYQVIEAARTPRLRAQEPRKLGNVLHAPDRLNRAATRLERQLNVPDCTGGTPLAPVRPTVAA